MQRRQPKSLNLQRWVGHGFGVVGALYAINSILTSVDPRFLQLFPFEAGGIRQGTAALVALGLIAIATWLVWDKDARKSGAKGR